MSNYGNELKERMDLMKISEMTYDELFVYIGDRINDVNNNINNFSEYYNNQNVIFNEMIKSEYITLDGLRNIAYNITDVSERVAWANKKQSIIDSISTTLNYKPKRGEIWTCEMGNNIGSEENKIRPVIIIQNNTGNDKSPTTIIIPISNKPKKIAVHIELKRCDYILVENESEEISGTILCEQIKVISKARLGRHIATLKPNFIFDLLNRKLKKSIEL